MTESDSSLATITTSVPVSTSLTTRQKQQNKINASSFLKQHKKQDSYLGEIDSADMGII